MLSDLFFMNDILKSLLILDSHFYSNDHFILICNRKVLKTLNLLLLILLIVVIGIFKHLTMSKNLKLDIWNFWKSI